MIPEYFGVVAAMFASCGGFYYLYCTIKGTVQPNRVIWFFWGAFPMIGFFAQLNQGVGLIAWATFFAGLAPFLIVIASSINKNAYWEIQKVDYLFAGIALIGLLLWQITDDANFALTFSILADFAVALPTIIKSYTSPDSESPVAYGVSALGFMIALLAIQEWNYESVAFIAYLVFINGILTLLLLRKV